MINTPCRRAGGHRHTRVIQLLLAFAILPWLAPQHLPAEPPDAKPPAQAVTSPTPGVQNTPGAGPGPGIINLPPAPSSPPSPPVSLPQPGGPQAFPPGEVPPQPPALQPVLPGTRFPITIDPKTPVKDLLPAAPKVKKRAAPALADDLTQVPEIEFEAALARDLPSTDAMKHIAHTIARINHVNASKTDAFIDALRAERADIAALPMAMGNACRTKGERSKQFNLAVNSVRRANFMQNADTFWDQYHALCVQEDRSQPGADRSLREHITQARIAALMQLLAPTPASMRLGLVKYLATVSHVDATHAIAKLAIFSPEEDLRQAAVDALKVRRDKDYTDILLQGLRYPWPAVARRASEVLVKLERTDLIPQLLDVLEEPDPRAPVLKEVNKKETAVVRELVRINHHRNCLLCHAPGNTGTVSAETLTAPIPVPGEALTPPQQGYGNSIPEILVRLDVTYLRQDFSVLQAVEDANPWPEMQRFDFLVRTRALTGDEAKTYQDKLTKREAGQQTPYQQTILNALRELTGKDTEPTPEAWRKLLDLADKQARTVTQR